MRCLFHRWGKWEDCGQDFKGKVDYPAVYAIHVIKQTRRCAKCNRIQTATT